MPHSSPHVATPEESAEIRALVADRGEPVVCERLGVTRSVLARLVGGLGVRRASLIVARAGLERLRGERAA